jgi:hypothetical protein
VGQAGAANYDAKIAVIFHGCLPDYCSEKYGLPA